MGGGGSRRSNISLENEIQRSHRNQHEDAKTEFFFFCLLTLRLINRFRNDGRRFKGEKFMSWLYRDNPVIYVFLFTENQGMGNSLDIGQQYRIQQNI